MKTQHPVLYLEATWREDGFPENHTLWEMARRRAYEPTVLSYRPQGFPLAPNEAHYPGLKICTPQLTRPICGEPASWRQVSVGLRRLSTGYYCQKHIDQTLVDQVKGERTVSETIDALALLGTALENEDLPEMIVHLETLVEDLPFGAWPEAQACLDLARAGQAIQQAVFTTIQQKLGRQIQEADAQLTYWGDLADAASL